MTGPTLVAVTTDVVLLTVRAAHLEVLLVERRHPPFAGAWALPGGFVDPDEDLEAAARRELAEETGVELEIAAEPRTPAELDHLEQLRSYGRPDRDPRGRTVTIAYLAFMRQPVSPRAGDDAAQARFWPVSELALPALGHTGIPLAFDHAEIVSDGVERARAKLEYTTLGTALLPEPFTLGQLRGVYEAVWGTELHEANFRRKVLRTTGFVEETGAVVATAGRPARTYVAGRARRLHPPILRPGADT